MQTNEDCWIWKQLNLSTKPHTADMKGAAHSKTEKILCSF